MDHTKKLITDEMQDETVDFNTDLNYIELEESVDEEEDVENTEKYFPKSKKNEEKLPDDYWQNFDKIIPKPHEKKSSSSNVNVNVGDQIKHKKWGLGVVEEIQEAEKNDRLLFIQFKTMGKKKLLQSVAPIEKL